MIRAPWLVWLSAAAMIVSWLAAVACGEVVDVPVLRRVPETGHLGDLKCRMPARFDVGYPHPVGAYEVTTKAHGATHDLNSYIRDQHGGTGRVNAAFIPGGKSLVLPEPSQVTLVEIVRSSQHSATLRVEMGGQDGPLTYWNEQPLYLLDELSAYCNGAAAGLQAGKLKPTKDSVSFARDLLGYSRTMTWLLRARRYKQVDEVDCFLKRADQFLTILESDLQTEE